MCRTAIFILSGAALLLSSCGANTTNGNVPVAGGQDSTLPPVETKRPNTDYKPAFTGQTRVGGIRTAAAYEGRVVTNALKNPWGITSLPDGRLLVNEKGGTMRIVTTSGAVGEPISGLPPVNSSGQGGLLGITIDPQFSTNRMVYWTFSESTPEGNLTSVAKGSLSADEKRMENVAVIYRATPAYRGNLHYGSRILVDKSGNLVFSTGERSDKITRPQAQDLRSALGKIIRITKEGQPASGNPFAGRSDARPEFYSYGHRNVQGLAFHPETGDLWENEFGPLGGDELNLIRPGLNYGWPVIGYGYEYSGERIGGGITQQAGMEQPVYYWDPVLSPSGMSFYSGSEM
ncbi:MAG TPA: PQQ-dependent sugar dehydrogenase, partial [Flavisolibacter sp.]|nr:PQQ-dependent sugar dehydrogenase [Flavisolibacter sp.]